MCWTYSRELTKHQSQLFLSRRCSGKFDCMLCGFLEKSKECFYNDHTWDFLKETDRGVMQCHIIITSLLPNVGSAQYVWFYYPSFPVSVLLPVLTTTRHEHTKAVNDQIYIYIYILTVSLSFDSRHIVHKEFRDIKFTFMIYSLVRDISSLIVNDPITSVDSQYTHVESF